MVLRIFLVKILLLVFLMGTRKTWIGSSAQLFDSLSKSVNERWEFEVFTDKTILHYRYYICGSVELGLRQVGAVLWGKPLYKL